MSVRLRATTFRRTGMLDDHSTADPSATLAVECSPGQHGGTTRRAFLRILGAAGALAVLPGIVTACDSDPATAPLDGIPASGSPLLIDFAQGDAAILQFALVLERLEAEFYTRVVAGFGSSNITVAEQAVLTEIRNHEIAHRAFLEGALGATGGVTATPTFSGINLADRATVLAAAKAF